MSFFSDEWVSEVQGAEYRRRAPSYDSREIERYINGLTERVKAMRIQPRKAIDG